MWDIIACYEIAADVMSNCGTDGLTGSPQPNGDRIIDHYSPVGDMAHVQLDLGDRNWGDKNTMKNIMQK